MWRVGLGRVKRLSIEDAPSVPSIRSLREMEEIGGRDLRWGIDEIA
jgi:hypothetical protein